MPGQEHEDKHVKGDEVRNRYVALGLGLLGLCTGCVGLSLAMGAHAHRSAPVDLFASAVPGAVLSASAIACSIASVLLSPKRSAFSLDLRGGAVLASVATVIALFGLLASVAAMF